MPATSDRAGSRPWRCRQPGEQRPRTAPFLLEATDHTVERIADQVGFASTTTFRDHFGRVVGTSPGEYSRAFRARPHPTRSDSDPADR